MLKKKNYNIIYFFKYFNRILTGKLQFFLESIEKDSICVYNIYVNYIKKANLECINSKWIRLYIYILSTLLKRISILLNYARFTKRIHSLYYIIYLYRITRRDEKFSLLFRKNNVEMYE